MRYRRFLCELFGEEKERKKKRRRRGRRKKNSRDAHGKGMDFARWAVLGGG